MFSLSSVSSASKPDAHFDKKIKKTEEEEEEEEEGEEIRMGNCLFRGLSHVSVAIKVITSNGGIMEFHSPITVGSITDEFPGHSIFSSHDLFHKPLSHHEELFSGKSYYLLPLADKTVPTREGHARSNSLPDSVCAPYRMSLDERRETKRYYGEVFSREDKRSGIWKVKLVISPKQLLEILKGEGSTEELLQSVRTVAKCGSLVGYSDQWSLSSYGSSNT